MRWVFILIFSISFAHASLTCQLAFLPDQQKYEQVYLAYEYAAKAHKGVIRKFEELPYIVHPDRVAQEVLKYTKDPDVLMAALLHDVIEDSAVTYNMLRERFGKRVADLVQELSSDAKLIDSMGKTAYLTDKLLKMSDDALMIKLLDRKDNLRDLAVAEQAFVTSYADSTREILNAVSYRDLTRRHKLIINEILSLLP